MAESTETRAGVDREALRITELLREARERTVRLIEPLSDDELRQQHDPLMSPIVWDLGHIAHFEELWLTRNVHGTVEFGEMPGIYNPFEHPRRVRGALDLPGRDEALEIMAEVRERVLAKFETLDLEAGDPLLRDGYVYAMVAQHEHQHNETILQTLQLKRGAPYRAPRSLDVPEPSFSIDVGAMMRFPGGACRLSIAASSIESGRLRLQSSQILRRRRCAIAPISVDEIRNGWMPRSMRRVTEVEASFVCSVAKTRWPVSAACTAFCAVS